MAVKSFKVHELNWKARLRFPKNNYFCYRWRVLDNFNRSIDREWSQMRIQGGTSPESLINERILALYKTTFRKSTKNDFMSQITKSALIFLENRKKSLSEAVREETSYNSSMTMVVDRVYDLILACSTELNAVLGFSELFVAATEPDVFTLTTNGTARIVSVRTRFSTNHYSLVVQGRKNEIAFYVLPVEDLIGLPHGENGRAPFLLLDATIEEDEVVWRSNAQELDEDSLEDTCMTALNELMQVTKATLLSRSAVAAY